MESIDVFLVSSFGFAILLVIIAVIFILYGPRWEKAKFQKFYAKLSDSDKEMLDDLSTKWDNEYKKYYEAKKMTWKYCNEYMKLKSKLKSKYSGMR